MLFSRVSDEEINKMNRYLLNYVSDSSLRQVIEKIGLTPIEEQITLLRYGKDRLSVEELCDKLCISLGTYKRHRRNILYKIAVFAKDNME